MKKVPRSSVSRSRQRGQGMAEYIIILALVAVAGIATWGFVGSAIHKQASAVASELAGGSGAGAQGEAAGAATSASGVADQKNLESYTGQNGGGTTGPTGIP